MTAPLYTLANFTCEGTGVSLAWTVQGHLLNDTIKQNREISVTTNNISVNMWSSVLTIIALPTNNNRNRISIGCLVLGHVSGQPVFDLKGINFTIKGNFWHSHYSLHLTLGITQVENFYFNFNVVNFSSNLSWSPPSFSSENTPISYQLYVENQHGQLLYNDITEDTSYKLYNLTACDIYTATVIAHSGEYNSSNVTIKDEYNGGNILQYY